MSSVYIYRDLHVQVNYSRQVAFHICVIIHQEPMPLLSSPSISFIGSPAMFSSSPVSLKTRDFMSEVFYEQNLFPSGYWLVLFQSLPFVS